MPDKFSIDFNFLIDIIHNFETDNYSSVRLIVPSIIKKFCNVFTKAEQIAKLSLKFQYFVNDRNSKVRKSAAQNLHFVSEQLKIPMRQLIVVPLFCQLLQDSDDQVRYHAYEHIGKIIGHVGSSVDHHIVEEYCSALCSNDSLLSFNAAYYFSFVALGIGSKRWNELQSSYIYAAGSEDYFVRRALAFGLSSLAPIVDAEEVESYADQFLQDIPEVAIGVISNLHVILKYVENKFSLFSY